MVCYKVVLLDQTHNNTTTCGKKISKTTPLNTYGKTEPGSMTITLHDSKTMTEDKPRLQPKNNESSLGNNHKPIAGYKDLIEVSESDKDIYIHIYI